MKGLPSPSQTQASLRPSQQIGLSAELAERMLLAVVLWCEVGMDVVRFFQVVLGFSFTNIQVGEVRFGDSLGCVQACL